MEDPKPVDLDVLYAQVQALENARKQLEGARPGAGQGVRRLAHALRRYCLHIGLSELATAAAMVERSDELTGTLDVLIERLHAATARKRVRSVEILVVTAEAADAELLGEALAAPNRVVTTVASRAAAWRALEERHVAAVFLDIAIAEEDGRDLLLEIRDESRYALLPVILVADEECPGSPVECVALGADSILHRPLRAEEASIVAFTALRRSALLSSETHRDSLTGLPNRTAFEEDFQQWQVRAARSSQPNSLGFLDLDHFKEVNDSFGHDIGDKVLCVTAEIIANTLRESDILARWGGEEFMALFPESTEAQARQALKRALHALRRARIEVRDGEHVSMSFSAGVTQVEPDEALDEAILRADRYLYLAKAAGRNHVLSAGVAKEPPSPLILYADDDRSSSLLVVELLSRQGFRVLHFEDGASLLQAAEDATPDLILLDVRMPIMDGYAVLEELRRRPGLADVPVVLITAAGSEAGLVRGFRLGADEYIEKPIAPTTFLARIFRLMKSTLKGSASAPRVAEAEQ